MRQILILIISSLMLTSLVGCKTNEKNMSDAYNKAMAGREADERNQDDIYKSIRKEMHHTTMVVGSDSLDVSTQYVRVTEKGGGVKENIKKYCVVVGQFKQAFNARSMRERLADNGYPGCFVVETREPYYFVVAGSYSDIGPAVDLLDKVKTDGIFKFKAPLPFILRPSQIR